MRFMLLTLDGLHPPSPGARVSFKTGKPVVIDGATGSSDPAAPGAISRGAAAK